jgi:ankyrin repeat protein
MLELTRAIIYRDNAAFDEALGNTPELTPITESDWTQLSSIIPDELAANLRADYLPVHIAAAVGNIAALVALHQKFPDSMCIQNAVDGYTPLHVAVQSDCVDSVRAILAHTTIQQRMHLLQIQDISGHPPLHTAADKGTVDSVREILAAVCSYENMMVLLLMQDRNKTIPLHWAVKYNKIDSVKEILAAAGHGVMELLLAADINGDTALGLIARCGEIDFVIEILIGAGLDYNDIMVILRTPNQSHTTLLDEAVQFVLTLSILQRLVEHGFHSVKDTLMQQDENSKILIHEASKPFSYHIVNQALEEALEAVPNSENMIARLLQCIRGNTPLHELVLYWVVTSVNEILGADEYGDVINLFLPIDLGFAGMNLSGDDEGIVD